MADDDTEHVPVEMVEYIDEDTDIEFDDSGENPRVENHDELKKQPVICMLPRETVEEHGLERDIVEEGDTFWEEAQDLDPAESVEVGEAYV